MKNLGEIAPDPRERLISLFVPDEKGRRPCFGAADRDADSPDWQNLLLFRAYFHGEAGERLMPPIRPDVFPRRPVDP